MRDKLKIALRNKYFRLLVFVLLGIFILSQIYDVYIDMYNFRQLENVQNTLNKLDKNSYEFQNLKEYNKEFNQDVRPIKNCYFLADRNRFFENSKRSGGYIFGFKLESFLYRIKYGSTYYAYSKYDLPYRKLCLVDKCTDSNKNEFTYTINNPCWD